MIPLHQKVGEHVVVSYIKQLINHGYSLFMHLKQVLPRCLDLSLYPKRWRFRPVLLMIWSLINSWQWLLSLSGSAIVLPTLHLHLLKILRAFRWVSLGDILHHAVCRVSISLIKALLLCRSLPVVMSTLFHRSKLLLLPLRTIRLHLLLPDTWLL